MSRRAAPPPPTNVPSPAECAAAADGCACFNLRKASRAVTAVYDEALAPIGLSSGQYVLLLAARFLGETTIQKFADTVWVDRSALGRNIQPLVQRKLLSVVTGADRRTRCVRLTPAGLVVLTHGLPLWREAQKRLAGNLSRQGFDDLMAVLGRSLERMAAS